MGREMTAAVTAGNMASSEQAKAAQQALSESILLQEICDANGLSRDDFVNHRHQVETIELFLMTIETLKPLMWFPNIVKLQVIHQEIETISGLEPLVNLEYLWLNENRLTKIQGLQANTKLKELYLYSNEISAIEGLDTLQALEVLWLQDNKITELDGLSKLSSLRVLWVAANCITSIGHRLDPNVELEELNIAGNYIGSFREIPYLDRLVNLQRLFFYDPHFGDNPVCQLCNYQTYTLYHLNHIKVLDYNAVSDENRHLADATFVKKKMYYNMRIKTLRRNTSNLIKKAAQFRQTKFSEVNLAITMFIRMAKELEREIEEARPYVGTDPQSKGLVEAIEAKLKTVRSCIAKKNVVVEEIDSKFLSMKGMIETISQHNISRLLVELQTGGNIRMEEGRPTDVWHQSCVDLVKSRFFPSDFEPFGIKDVRITKVTRIHNRFLRNRFEDRLETLVDTSNQAYKKALEYLFYGDDPDLTGEMTSAIEEGFRVPSEYEQASKDGGVPLSNSVFICEQNRLLRLYNKGLLGNSSYPGNPPQPTFRRSSQDPEAQFGMVGRLLITKVFLGKCCPERAIEGRPTPANPNFDPLVSMADGAVHTKIRRRDYSNGVGSVYRVKNGDTKQRVWFCFDNYVILPEYLVELVYIPIPTAYPTAHLPLSTIVDPSSTEDRLDELQDVINKLVPTRSELDTSDIRSFAHYFLSFIHQCNTIVSGDKEMSSELHTAPPIPKQRPKLSAMDSETIKKVCQVDHLAEIPYLNLFGNHIRKMECIPECTNIRVLILAFNEIQRLEGVADLVHLEHLDVSFNLIKRVEGLRNLPSLVKLEINNNLIYRLEDINVLKRSVPTITDLNMQNNAICEVKSYKYIVLRRVSGLKVFDGKPVTEDEVKCAQEKLCIMTPDVVLSHSHSQPVSGWARTLLPLGTSNVMHWKESMKDRGLRPRASDNGGSAPPIEKDDARYDCSESDDERSAGVMSRGEEQMLGKVVEVNLAHMRIRKIQGLEKCHNMRKLNLSDNEINRIEGFDGCIKLEELNLEDNRIIKIEGMLNLTALRKLELGKNKINKIEGLENLPHLCQVSLEDNDIYSLQGIQKIPELMELYIGNNKIDSTKEINILRDVPKLIILDLSGNPLCSETEYRLYTIFSLKKLKVLDGMSIDLNESNKAKETFAGKMTAELLSEKVKRSPAEWSSITDLNLSSCSIKELSLLDQFPSLLHLKCDHNLLCDVSGLRACTSLASLNLNSNRITSSDSSNGKPGVMPLGKCLEQMTYLESLSLESNQITSVAGLCLKLPNLKFLNVRSNDISKVDGLEQLPQLRELIFDRNKLRCFEEKAFAGCANLRDLRAEENMIKSLDGLGKLTSLTRIFLTANRLSDLSELEKLDGLDRVIEIYITGNAVARKSLYRPTLIHKLPNCMVIDGKEVTEEEREKAELFFSQEYYTYQHPPNVYTDRTAAGGQGAGTKGAVKLVSFEYHDSQNTPVYHQDGQGKGAPTYAQQRGRPVIQGTGTGVVRVPPQGVRTSSADGSHATNPPARNAGQTRQPKLGMRQRPSYTHVSFTSPRPGTAAGNANPGLPRV
eukprot:Sspe_Gene.6755::Locus_2269_Transcript_1_1_Confidence_1.000_Length_4905::g.6755::m.6755